jgi:hypothetical protein
MITFSRNTGIQRVLLSPPTKKIEKIKKIKFGTKIEFLKTKGISYLRAKRWSEKMSFYDKFQSFHATCFTYLFLNLSHMSLNSTFPKKKNIIES